MCVVCVRVSVNHPHQSGETGVGCCRSGMVQNLFLGSCCFYLLEEQEARSRKGGSEKPSVSGWTSWATRDAYCYAANNTAMQVSPGSPHCVPSMGISCTSWCAHRQRIALDSSSIIRGKSRGGRREREGGRTHGRVTEGRSSQQFKRQPS